MNTLELLFWACTAWVTYTYVGYPFLIGLSARFRGRPARPSGRFSGSISVVLPVHNEKACIARRVDELTRMLASSELDAEVVVVSDGSTDDTAMLAKRHATESVEVVELPIRVGKAEALTIGCRAANGDIIVFADARQRWSTDALRQLLRNFTDPKVGAVSGNLILETDSGIIGGVGLYWRYEKWLRQKESLVHSIVGVTGAISAVRRELFRPIPAGILVDDLYWPLQVVMQGSRVVYEENALAFDQLPKRTKDEFRRKVRTQTGIFQLLTHLPAALLPWRNPISLQFLSHKVMRLGAPWGLFCMLIVSALLPSLVYQIAFVVQLALYLLGLFGILAGSRSRLRMISAPGSFLLLNVAAWLAFWVWLTGKTENAWKKARYDKSNLYRS